MDVEITKLNGESFRLSDYDVIVRDFDVSSIPVEGVYGDVEGRSGLVNYGAEFGQRTITIPIYTKAYDMGDYALLRDELFGLMTTSEPFYVREMRRQSEFNTCGDVSDDKYVGGKRYKVRVTGAYNLEQMRIYGFGEISLVTTELPYAESIGTTADIDKSGLSSEDALWSFDMGLLATDDSVIYTHQVSPENIFRVYNAGDVCVHPFDQDLKITVSNVLGSDEMFQLTNHSNGSRFRVSVPIESGDVVVYDGPNVTSNGLQFLRNTRKDFITLSPGWNELEIYYCDSAMIEFDFRFYYL